jgi:delta24(24(1))-sterol reductase
MLRTGFIASTKKSFSYATTWNICSTKCISTSSIEYIKDPKYLKAECGSTLLIDGWWEDCRKPHYTADICMATCSALSCHQWPGILPYFYPIFFTGMIIHRYTRDVARCKAKYSKDWTIYCERVPYGFIPGLV